MKKGSKKKLTKLKDVRPDKLTVIPPIVQAPTKLSIGITYLREPFGFKHFYKCYSADKNVIKQFYAFLDKARMALLFCTDLF